MGPSTPGLHPKDSEALLGSPTRYVHSEATCERPETPMSLQTLHKGTNTRKMTVLVPAGHEGAGEWYHWWQWWPQTC